MSNEKILTVVEKINAYVEAYNAVAEKTSDLEATDATDAIGLLISDEILDNWPALYRKLKVALLDDGK